MPAALNEQNINALYNTELSDTDRAFLVICYTRNKPHTLANEWDLGYALDKFGITGETKDYILNERSSAERRQKLAIYIATKVSGTAPSLPDGPLDAPTAPSTAKGADNDQDIGWCKNDILGYNDEASSGGLAPAVAGSGPLSAASLIGAHLWTPGDTIYYYFQQTGAAYTYRQGKFREFLGHYTNVTNLTFTEVMNTTTIGQIPAIRIFFDNYDIDDNWSKRGKMAIGWSNPSPANPTLGREGGLVDTTIYLCTPDTQPGAGTSRLMYEQRKYYHELGHIFGLIHEHDSPASLANGSPDPLVGVYTYFDPHSVMLYPNIPLNGRSSTTQINYTPSATDYAFLTVSLHLFA